MRKTLTRREFLAGAGLAVTSLPLLCSEDALAVPDERPNFLFILTDDQRWDSMSCAGNPVIHTPNMDRIAKEGAHFRNAFVTCALCSPSRASFLTGRYPHSHGVRDNETAFNDSVPTFPLLLRRAGYETAFMGKWHMSMQEGPRAGFDRWIGLIGQGEYYNPTFYFDSEKRQVSGYVTDLLTNYALEWLEQRSDRPFCLCLSHKAAHADFLPAVRHSKLFENMPMPRPKPDTLEGKPDWVKRLRRDWGEEGDTFVRNYFRTLMAVDEGIGRILELLEDMGKLDHTVIVFAGDNGFFMGEHGGLRDKRHMYEESIRIPLVMRYPRLIKPGTLVDRMVLNIDICPTFLDLAGVRIPAEVQGQSLVPLLQGRTRDWREEFLYVYEFEPQYKKRPGTRGVRTDRWKYIEYPDIKDKCELYDLKNDPDEIHNLANDPSHSDLLADMRTRLIRLILETGYTPPTV